MIPYVDDKGNRVAYNLRARALRALATGAAKAPGTPAGADAKAAA